MSLNSLTRISSDFGKWEQSWPAVPDIGAWQILQGLFRFFYSSGRSVTFAETLPDHFLPLLLKIVQKAFFDIGLHFRALPDIRLTGWFWSKTTCNGRGNLSTLPWPLGSCLCTYVIPKVCLYNFLGTGGPRLNFFLPDSAWHGLNPKCPANFWFFSGKSGLKIRSDSNCLRFFLNSKPKDISLS